MVPSDVEYRDETPIGQCKHVRNRESEAADWCLCLFETLKSVGTLSIWNLNINRFRVLVMSHLLLKIERHYLIPHYRSIPNPSDANLWEIKLWLRRTWSSWIFVLTTTASPVESPTGWHTKWCVCCESQPIGFSRQNMCKLRESCDFHLFFLRHRAVMLETVAAVPGMVAGMVRHLRSLRSMKHDGLIFLNKNHSCSRWMDNALAARFDFAFVR